MLKDRDEATQQWRMLEDILTKTCSEFPNLSVQDEEAPSENVSNISLALRESKNNMDKEKFSLQM